MPAQPGRRSDSEDPFADILRSVAESPSPYRNEAAQQKAAELAAKIPSANITTPDQLAEAEARGARGEQMKDEEPQPIRGKKKAKKKPPTKRIETDEQSRTKRKKSG